jgi:glycosyltransferase involved in cell wall biosynthesis
MPKPTELANGFDRFMNSTLISCIVPVYNGERYLGETLDSILAQTHQPLEIVVVDDGSTDRTVTVVADFGRRVQYCWQENAGEAAARNRGLSMAQTEFVAFLDADDLWHPEKLARQIAYFQENPHLDLCFTSFQNFWIPELAAEEQRYRGSPLAQPQSAWSTSTVLARRAVFARFGNFIHDGSLAAGSESMIWFLRAQEEGALIAVLPEVLMYRRMHTANCSRTNPLETFFPILKEWRDYQRRSRGR